MWSLGRVAVTAVLTVALAGGKDAAGGSAHTAAVPSLPHAGVLSTKTAVGGQEGCEDSLGVLCAMLAGRVQGAGPDGQPDLAHILVSAYRRIDQAMKAVRPWSPTPPSLINPQSSSVTFCVRIPLLLDVPNALQWPLYCESRICQRHTRRYLLHS